VKGKTEKKIYIKIKKEDEEGKLSGRTNSMQKAEKKKSEETHQGYSQRSTFMQNLAK
jgi:hypothetical protein